MDAYLVEHERPSHDDQGEEGGPLSGEEGGDLFDAASLGHLKDDVTEYLAVIQRMAPAAGLSIMFDVAAAAAAGEAGTIKPLLKLLVDAMAKIFEFSRTIESLTRRGEVMQANIDRLQYVRVQQEHAHATMDKEVARLESALCQQKLDFQRDNKGLRQEVRAVWRVGNLSMSGVEARS
jgi:hypothetical protein